MVDARNGMVALVSSKGNFVAASHGPTAQHYLLLIQDADALVYDTKALLGVATLTGVRDAAFFPNGSHIHLAQDGTATLVSAAGTSLRWPLPGRAVSVAAAGTDFVVGLVDGTWRVARDVVTQAQVLLK